MSTPSPGEVGRQALTSVAALACFHVLSGTRPIHVVILDDGRWSFTCGDMHDDDPRCWDMACLEHLVTVDATVQDVLDLEDGWEAERNAVDAPWSRSECPAGEAKRSP